MNSIFTNIVQHLNAIGYISPVICSVGSRAFGYDTENSDWDYVVYSSGITDFSVEKYENCDFWYIPLSYIPFEGSESYIHLPDLANIVYCESSEFSTYISDNLQSILVSNLSSIYSSLAYFAYHIDNYPEARAAKSIAVSVLRIANVLERYYDTGLIKFELDDSYIETIYKIKLNTISPIDAPKYTNGIFSEPFKSYFSALPIDSNTILGLKAACTSYLRSV